jgi:hypothetical protein
MGQDSDALSVHVKLTMTRRHGEHAPHACRQSGSRDPDAARCLAIITSSNSSSAGGLLLCNMVVAWCDLLFVPLSAAADPSSRAASADPPDASA